MMSFFIEFSWVDEVFYERYNRKELKNRFKHVFVMYDNDQFKETNAGKLAGEKLAKDFDILDILIPDVFQLKDPSDFREKQGVENTRNMIISLVKEKIKQYNI